ncbi:hypothetical protein GEV33_008035 [Tenebrio molitor]|uniref:Uncharacterized protein n=1 Tax=Tenebrio molitor TaxID=7067 RepID=A0A8J6HHB1_TENMO|nr:hypothetical protein GEV33_008035 [Tenebrio molitor]
MWASTRVVRASAYQHNYRRLASGVDQLGQRYGPSLISESELGQICPARGLRTLSPTIIGKDESPYNEGYRKSGKKPNPNDPQPFPFHHYGPIRYLAVGFFLLFFPMWCGGAPGYFPRLPTPTLSSPSSFFWTPQHEYKHKHPWEAHPAWDSNPADLAVVSEECRSSFHHPTVSP